MTEALTFSMFHATHINELCEMVVELPHPTHCLGPSPGGKPNGWVARPKDLSPPFPAMFLLSASNKKAFVWVVARAFVEKFPLVGLDHNTGWLSHPYSAPMKAAAPCQQWKLTVCSAPEMLFCSLNREDAGMLANDGTDDHLGPHL